MTDSKAGAFALPAEPTAESARQKKAHTFKRDPLDWYVEPQDCTAALLTVERFVGSVLDPACGQGNIVRSLRDAGVEAFGSDIRRRVPEDTEWFIGEADFLKVPHTAVHQASIVTNPPFYKGAGTEAFIRASLKAARHKVAIFTDLKFLGGDKRAATLYAEHTPHRVWLLTPRPSCPPGEYLLAGNKAGGGTADWVWVVWDLTAPPVSRPTFGWLRRAK